LFDRVASTFQAYWEDADFESFVSGDVDRLATAIAEQRSSATSRAFLFDLRPYTFQQEILDRLSIEREQQGRKRQLIVAATGTGKTMIAAFDYRRLVEARRHAPRMLFVAHRIELLQQALESFRAVLKDPNFGELLGGGSLPRSRDHLFATIQSINSQDLLEFVSPDHYEYVVVDEFHHAPAAQYQRLLEWLEPTILVGMTATPERMSVGAASWDVFGFFDQHVSAEIRLPDAIQRKLLSPFHYFGVTDTVDYSQISWSRGSYDQNQLDNLLTGDMMRAQRVFSALEERVADPNSMRCLGFCVSVRHAEFMAQCFRSLDIKAHALTSASSIQDREILPNALRRGDIQVLFTVDLFNEGIDIPELDTVLLLRPTESLTVFLQQLGRGLRLSDKKDCLTVLDFVGHMHRHFRFDDRLRALTTKPEPDMRAQVQSGFPWLPAGCHLELEEQAMRHVLENISEHLGRRGKREWVAYLREYAGSIGRRPSLHEFLRHLRRTPSDLYRVSSWTELLALAGFGPTAVTDPKELDALQRFAAIDDDLRLDALESVLAGHEPDDQRLTLMLCALALPSSTPRFDYLSLVEAFKASSVLSTDLRELTTYLRSESELWTIAANVRHALPLRLHASYTRGEVLAALGSWTPERQFTEQSGNRWVEDIRTDALLVTLNKSSREFSPTTMYEDYAISDRLFHWQSQSSTAIESQRAKRYVEHAALGNTILLFVRENRKRGRLAEPFVFLGPVEHVSHHGTRPVNFTWRIETPIPARFVHELQHLTA